MNLLDPTDIDFILAQLRLAGNDPRNTPNGTPLDPRGIRDVQGVGNNLNNPSWGNADTLFPRVTAPVWRDAQGSFTMGQFGPAFDMTPVSYAIRDINLIDNQPRIISNLVSSQSAESLAAIGYVTPGQQKLATLDDPSSTPNGRLSPLTGPDNPLPYSGFMTLFGQFFDHGLDFVQKGKDGLVMVQILPGDPLYNDPRSANGHGGYNNFILASRTNTVHVDIARSSTDSLISALGLAEDRYTAGDQGFAVGRITGSAPVGDTADGGVIILNNQAINIARGATAADVVTAINAVSANTGVTASLDGTGRLLLDYQANESVNTTSSFIDLSQSYGSAPSHTAFVREYSNAGGVISITGALVSSVNGGESTWADIKANALKAGVVLHDKDVLDIPEVRLAVTGSPFIDATPGSTGLWLVSRDHVTGQVYYVKDSLISANSQGLRLEQDGSTTLLTGADFDAVKGNLLLQGIGHAFLDDMAHGVLNGLSLVTGDLADPTLLNAHFVAGDGRANENIGLTSIHEVFHAEHNRVLGDIQALVLGGTDSDGVTWTARPDAATWTGEDFFQAAKLVTEMQYQHLVFAEFTRKLSPNINAFATYDITINPAVSAEFAHAVYRFGHSMLRETVDMEGFDAATGLANGTDNSMGLIQAFLNPLAYTDSTAGEVALGMSKQVGNEIDEWVTDALQNNLLGLPLDLATLNIVRGRDTGIGSLNDVRADLYAQTGLASLKPYASWDDFGAHLVHPESLENFIMAYARDTILTQFGDSDSTTPGIQTQDLAAWNALQASETPSDQQAYSSALRAAAISAIDNAAFMNGNVGLNGIDFWLGGLAETKVPGGMLGSTFDFIFATQMIHLQNADRFYYLNRLAGTNLLASIDTQFFSDIVMRNTGVKHLYSDIFSVADSTIELTNTTQTDAAGSLNSLSRRFTMQDDIEGNSHKVNTAGWVYDGSNYTFYGNPGEYLDARGVYSPNNTATIKGNASETIGGTENADRINSLGGNDTVWGDGGNDTIEGGLGNDFLHGGSGDDVITDEQGDDHLWGNDGNDNLNGGSGIDALFGGFGNDTLRGGLGADAIDGGIGDDLIYGESGAITTQTFGGVQIQVMDSSGQADVIIAGGGNDTIYGGAGDDVIDGGEDNDVIYGGLGNDVITGSFGDDLMVMDASDIGYGNSLDGGTETDTVDYSASVGSGPDANGGRIGVRVDMAPVIVPVLPVPGPPPPDVFISIENLIGSAYNDWIRGGANVGLQQNLLVDKFGVPVNFGTELVPIFRTSTVNINGGAGNDTIEGGDGTGRWDLNPATGTYFFNDLFGSVQGGVGVDMLAGGTGIDTISYETASSAASIAGVLVPVATPNLTGVTVDLRVTTVQDTINAGRDMLSGFENVTGSAFNDTINGDNNANVLSGLAGDDRLFGNAGDDTLAGGAGNDVIDGGLGINTASYAGAGSLAALAGGATPGVTGVTVNLGTVGQQDTVNDGLDTLTGISNLIGSTFADTLTGDANANRIDGGLGDDTLDGGNGNDTLVGGLGNDVINGNGGTDTVSYSTAVGAVTVNLNTNVASGAAGSDTLSNLENVEGSAFNDVLTGSGGSNSLAGGAGNDSIAGANGNDTLDGGVGSDTLDGGAGNDSLVGGADNDTLVDGNGTNTLVGGSGNDTYILGGGGDTIVELAGEGFDVVQTSSATLSLATFENVENLTYTGTAAFTGTGNASANVITGGVGNDVLSGGAGADTLNGGNGNDSLVGGDDNDTLQGGLGNDTLDGGNGVDSLVGGAGDDTYVLADLNDVIVELAGGGSDTVRVSVNGYVLAGEIENITLAGAVTSATGNALNNVLTGGTGNDTLDGGAGNDTLNGGAGSDSLIGGAGNDSMVGGAGNDTYVLADAGDVIIEAATANEIDTVQTALTSASLANFTNVENLTYTGSSAFSGTGNASNNTLISGAGNDSLNGGAGADVMNGGAGDDTYTVDNAGDTVTDSAGIDTILTSLATYSIAGNASVENLTYTGTAAFTGTGNAGDNIITGSTGSDTLDGGTGNDQLLGGLGNDTYVIDSLSDSITDTGGTDTVRTALNGYTLASGIENLTISAVAGIAVTGNELANTVTGGTGNDTLSGALGNDSLVGATGNDSLLGGDGNDSLTGGAGADTLTGGAGNDQFVYTATVGESVTGTRDVITDFVRGQDVINLSGLDANTATAGDQAFTFRGTQAFTGAAQIRMQYDAVNNLTLIQGNTNATTTTIELEIALQGNFTTGANILTATDFIL